MNIANVCLSDTWGDVEESAVVWAVALSGRGHEVQSIVTEGGRLSQALRDRGLKQVTVPRRANRGDMRAALKIRSFIRRGSMDIVQVHGARDLGTAYLGLAGAGSARLFLIINGLSKTPPDRGILNRFLNRKLSGVIVPTEIGKRVVTAAGRIPEEKIAVIPMGFDVAAYAPAAEVQSRVRARLELEDDHVVVGTIGRIGREKGQYELLEAARTVLRSHSGLRLVIAGDAGSAEGGKLLEFMRRRIREYHLEEIVKLMPPPAGSSPKGMPDLLSAFDIFVMPSLEENFSGPLVEAMLSGLACVGTEAGGTPEVLENGKAGLLAPSGSADGIARALTTLFETPDLRGILGRRARESARRRFDRDTVMKRVEDLYSAS